MLCIIQARMGSKRLPNKMLIRIDNQPILQHVINRVNKIKYVKKICVATTKLKIDDELAKYCKENNTEVFRGSNINVFDRFQKLCIDNKFSKVLRINGDSPLMDNNLFNKIIKISNNYIYDLFTNIHPRSFPRGQSLEIINSEIIKKFNQNLMTRSEKEHVTRYFYKNNKKYKIINYKAKTDCSSINLSIDTHEDLKKIIFNFGSDLFSR